MSLVRPTPPRSATAAFKEVRKIIRPEPYLIPDERSYGGHGAPGRLLENLLGIAENNRDSPDLHDWEIKFHGGGTLITLFHKDPEPRGIMRQLVHEHGWPDEHGRISFRHTIGGRSDRGFYVVNDPDRVLVRHDHIDIVVPYWLHTTLMNAIGAKLRRLILVEGQLIRHPQRAVIFNKATAYWEFDIQGFGNACSQGMVYIDFDARTQGGRGTALRNHGTKFRVHGDNLKYLYSHKQIIT